MTAVTRTKARRRRWWAEVGWKYPLALAIVLFAVFPLLYVLSASLKPGGSLAGSSALFRAIDPANYAALGGTSF
jgi:arabinogalactan oligomer / maltooligosaccharide transport system permease protein